MLVGFVLVGVAVELEGVDRRLTRSNSRSHTRMALKSNVNTRPLRSRKSKQM